jgi:hypothetical protein
VQGFQGDVSFAKADNYIDSLLALKVVPDATSRIAFPSDEAGSTVFAMAARLLASVESMGVVQNQEGDLLPLFAIGQDEKTCHKLDWLHISERKRSDEQRSCHELYIILNEDGVEVTFEHGKYGYRRERHTKWSSAFSRIAQIMSGECSWHQFGDSESQNTMLGKGQFYWVDQRIQKIVPVDNFVFRVADTFEVRLAGVGHRCALSVDRVGHEDATEWYADYAEGLLRMADVLEGAVDLTHFGEESYRNLYVNAKGWRAPEPGVAPLTTRGQFFVETIYQSGDVWPAPVLAYKTAEGDQVALEVYDGFWHVRLYDETGEKTVRKFPAESGANALRVLATVLRTGKFEHKDFDRSGWIYTT